MRKLSSILAALAAAALAAVCVPQGARAAETVGDMADVKGCQEQVIMGVGLVVGLRGTGDKGRETTKRISLLLNKLNLNVKPEDIATKNVALVMVTARVRPFAQQGTRMDVTVSSIGDAVSLAGGELLPTPMGANNTEITYVRAQGLVSVASADGGAGHPTAGGISKGGILEREIKCEALDQSYISAGGKKVDYIDLVLRSSDFTMASSIAEAANTWMRAPAENPAARAMGPTLIRIDIPEQYRERKVAFVDEIMHLPVAGEPPATVTINERTGVLVATGNVRISAAVISVGNIKLAVKENSLLCDVEKTIRNGWYSNAEFIAIVKELDKIGALHAKLICE